MPTFHWRLTSPFSRPMSGCSYLFPISLHGGTPRIVSSRNVDPLILLAKCPVADAPSNCRKGFIGPDIGELIRKHFDYTPETATFMDRFLAEREQVVMELFGEELKQIK
jgi:hypothetical protein